MKVSAYAVHAFDKPLVPFSFEQRDVGVGDVKIEILYCGICHSDVHQVRNEWGNGNYPMVPGHEIVGRVVEIGNQVKSYQIGDLVGVGCLVGSCGHCHDCKEGVEQYCNAPIFTYNSPDPHSHGLMTFGGYADRIVVDEKFVLRISSKLDLAGTAPLLCAGITTYSPLRHWRVGQGSRVGIVGLGGLGHMGLKLAHAMGAETVLFTTSPAKVSDAKRLGADEVVISRNVSEFSRYQQYFDFILNTVSVPHDLDQYMSLLKRDGTMCLVGVPPTPHPSPNIGNFIFKRRSLAGSLIGGIKETQEMLDFCAEKGIVSDIELIPIQQVNEAYERLVKADVKYRFVIDLGSLKKA